MGFFKNLVVREINGSGLPERKLNFFNEVYTLLQVGTQGGAQISRPLEITLFYHQENFIFKFLARVPKHQHCLEKQLLSIYRQILHSGLKIVIIRINKASRMSNKKTMPVFDTSLHVFTPKNLNNNDFHFNS